MASFTTQMLGRVAHGWSLSEISISRTGIKYDNLGNQTGPQYLVHPDTFSLVLNGTSYELYPDGTTTNPEVRYYAKDAPGLFIKRYYDEHVADVPNTDGLYWIVITSDGTLYRLGFTADSEKWQQANYRQVSGHQGRSNSISAMAWYADTVTDPFGNQMQYTYYTHNILENIYWVDDDEYSHSWQLTTQNVRINTISYNYPTRVTTLPPTNLTARLTGTPATRIEFRKPVDGSWDNNTDPVENIYIYHNSSQPIKEYRLTTTVEMVVSTACLNYDPDPDVGRATHTRVVTAIQQFANTDNNPLTLDGWGLPATTFSYASKAHFLKNGGDCSSFRYLSQVNNGYGGSTSFTYSRDDRAVGAYIPSPTTYGVYQWPDMGFNYFVTQVSSSDGRNQPVITTYSYTAPCYGQWDTGYVGGMSGATVCTSSGNPQLGNIVGFATTTQTNYDYNDNPLNRTVTTFGQTVGYNLGRPTRIDTGLMSGGTFVVLNRVDTDYATSTFGPSLSFIYTLRTKSYQYQNGVSGTYLSTKTEYAYNTSYQGGAQYGNLTHVYEYDSADAPTPYRTTYRVYYPNTGVTTGSNWYWNVNRVAAEGVYVGSSTALADLLRGVWTYYDGSSSLTTAPTKGAATRVRQFGKDPSFTCSHLSPSVPNCNIVYRTTESVMSYDVYGNQEYLYQPDDYGRLVYNSSGTLLSDLTATTTNYTFIDYDSTYNLYPISVTDAGGYVTTFQVYGFNGTMDGFQEQTGLLKQVTGANGVTTKYEYDPFGRLFATYDAGADAASTSDDFVGFSNPTVYDGDPVERYRYWDTTWNDATTFLNPAGNAPFFISIEKRPGSYPQPANSSSTAVAYNDQTFYDGFGRPIQTRSLWNWVEGQNLSREIISHTTYAANGQVNCQSIPYDVPFYSDQPKTWPTSPFYTAHTCTSQPHTTTTTDGLGRPLTITAPDSSTTNYSYYILTTLTADGRNPLALTNIEDANDHLIGQVTNSLGQLVIVQENSGTNPYTSQSRTWYTYDLMGNLTKVVTSDGDPSTNPTGNDILRQSTMSYDSLGRKTGMTDADMGSWSYAYDVAGNLVRQTDAKGQVMQFIYDALGRQTAKLLPTTNIPAFVGSWYDLGANATGQLIAQDVSQATLLDAFDTLQAVRWTSTGTVTIQNSSVNLNSASASATIAETSYPLTAGEGARFDFQVSQTSGWTAEFELSSSDSSAYQWELIVNNNTLYARARDNNTYTTSEALMPVQANRWYSAVLSIGDNGRVMVQLWERDNPAVQASWSQQLSSGASSRNYRFQAIISSGKGQAWLDNYIELSRTLNDSYTYDSLARLTGQTRLIDGRSYTMSYANFDAFHRAADVTYPNGDTVTIGYDHEGENSLDLDMNAASNPVLVRNLRFNAKGQMTYLDRADTNNTTVPDTTFSYFGATDVIGGGTGDSNFRLQRIQTGTLVDFNYQYDKVGNITKITDNLLSSNKTQTFGYDHLNRLITAYTPSGAVNPYDHDYVYDLLGNIDSRTETVNSVTSTYDYAYDNTAHIHAVTAITNTVNHTFGYDANGNMTSRTDDSGSYTQQWDVENRLIGVVNTTTGQTTQFRYDSSGQRVMTISQADATITYTPFAGYEEEIPLPAFSSFENSTGWSATTTFPGTSLWRSNWNTAAPSASGYAYALSNHAYGTLQSDYITVNPSTQYNLTAYVRGEIDPDDSSGQWIIRAHFYNNSNGSLGSQDADSGSAGSLSTTWQQQGGTITTPAGATKLKVSLYNYHNTGWVAYDNVSLTPIGGSNLVVNPGFESSGNWTEITASGFPATSFWRSTWGTASPQSGSYAYVISNHAYGAVRSALVNVTAGAQYDVYTYLRGEIDPEDSQGAWKIQVQYFNSSNTYLSSSDVDSGSSLSTTWQQEGGRITVPSGAAKLQVLLYSYQNNGWVAFDDVSLKQVGNSTNLLTNPGFESSGNWTTDSYADFPATAYWRNTWGTAAPRTGSYAYTISNHAYGNLTSTAIPVSPNTDYDLYALVRGELDAEDSEGGAWQIQLYFYDANNAQVGSYAVPASQTPGGLSTAWQEVGGRITTPPGTATVKIYLYTYLNSGWVAVDNVRLSRATDATIQRITYHLGGRAIATRIVGDPTSSNNGLFYIYSDHLNSNSVMSYYKLNTGSDHGQIGQAVAGSSARYLPFGGWRTEPTAGLTDMGFTSHKANNTGSGDIGLIYMNARFYLPGVGRFISADTIIPNPSNPQSFNRYSYTYNNPLRFTDPSGHMTCEDMPWECDEETGYWQGMINARIYFLNGIGCGPGCGEKITPNPNATDGQGYLLYRLEELAGKENVIHIPVYDSTTDYYESLGEMYAEMFGSEKYYTNQVVNQIVADRDAGLLKPGQPLIIVGVSGGGSIAIETLDLLEENGIYVDQVILRGSSVSESSLNNVGRIDYLASDPPISDWLHYSIDTNPFDGVSVNEIIVEGLRGHYPGNNPQLNTQIANLVVDAILVNNQ